MQEGIKMVGLGAIIALVIYTIVVTLYSLYTNTNLVSLILVGVFSASATTMFTLLGLIINPKK